MSNLRIVSKTKKLPYKKVLLVFKSIEIHPIWEKIIAGAPVGSFDFFSLSFPKRILLSKSHVEHVKANPRTMDYMLRIALDLFANAAPQAKLDALVDTAKDEINVARGVGKVWTANAFNYRPFPDGLYQQLKAEAYDCIVLLYPDPIGASWIQLERNLKGLTANTLVMNGRQRVFAWDAAARRKLAWRRFLSHFWVVEALITGPVILFAALLAGYDLTLRKLMRKFAK